MIKKGISAKKCNKKKQVYYEIQMDSDLAEIVKLGHQLVLPVYSHTDSGPDSRLKFLHNEPNASLRDAEEAEKSISDAIHNSNDVAREGTGSLKDGNFSFKHGCKEVVPLSSISLIKRELLPESIVGWPLLQGRRRRNNSSSQEAMTNFEERDISVVEWVMNLPGPYKTFTLEQNLSDKDSSKTIISSNRESDNLGIEDYMRERTLLQVNNTSEDQESVDGSKNSKDETFGPSSSWFLPSKRLMQLTPGWPLLRVTVSGTSDFLKKYEPREISVVQWVMNLPNRSTLATQQPQIASLSKNTENSVQRDQICSSRDDGDENCLKSPRKVPKELELSLKLISYGCKQFSYEELKQVTSHFSSENLIGEGGYSNVYKGCLPSGKRVAVKILKSYKEAWNDFSLEVDIISSVKHKHITPLIGVCIEDGYLISVYDFFSVGNLEGRLDHGLGGSEKSVLPWDVRFKVAVAVAEALNFLHNQCSRPIIHRDVKSSNILLSDDSLPQLSDFGLAIWGPATSTYMVHSDVVGSFGYIAPEYFMHGRVSDKIDVYSFGVVLLELLSGRKPINHKALKGQESLVKWAKPLLESGDIKELLDPNLGGNFDILQMHRMLLAATLCINHSAQYRPKASQILKLLRGENDSKRAWLNTHVNDLKEISSEEEDDHFLELGHKQHSALSALYPPDDDDAASLNSIDTTSLCSIQRKHHFMLKDYLKEPQD